MPVFRITCPKCAATATGTAARPLPAGKAIKCPRCGTVFRIPTAPPVQRPRETKVGPARVLPPRPQPKTPANAPRPPAKRVIYRITCPACKVLLKSATPPPLGKAVLCPKCRKPFVTRPRQTKLAAPPRLKGTKLSSPAAKPKETRLSPPQRPKQTKLSGASEKSNGRPVRVFKCPACAAVMRITGNLPAGKMFPCPRCRRPIAIVAKRPAKKTTLGQKAKRTTLVPARPKTVLAPKSGGVLPRGSLLRCPHCSTAFKSPREMPVGRLLKCSKCAKTFAASPVAAPKTVPVRKPRPTKTAPVRRPAPPPRKRSHLALYLLMATAVVAFSVIGLGYFDVIPLFPRRGIPDSAWREFVPPDGNCRIEMPGTPELKHARAYGPGGSDAQKYVVIRGRQDAAFYLAISERPAKALGRDSLEAIYAAERAAVVSVAKGRLARERDVMMAGHPAKEFQIDFPDGAMFIERVCLVRGPGGNGRVYVLAAAGADVEDGPAARFFDSFQIEMNPRAAARGLYSSKPHFPFGACRNMTRSCLRMVKPSWPSGRGPSV